MELTLEEVLKKGIDAHKAGQIQEADRLYTAILNAQPKHPDTNHNMGVLAVSINKIQESLPFFKTALDANPSIVQFWLSYIDALIKLGHSADAQAAFDLAKAKGTNGVAFDQLELRLAELTTNPLDPPSEQLQPITDLYIQGQFQQALSHTTEMLERFPSSAFLHNISGASNAGLMQFDAAISSYKQALRINPNYVEVYNNMGIVLNDKGNPEDAIGSYKKALQIQPNFAEVHNGMGIALKNAGEPKAAIDSYQVALRIKPDYAEAHNNLGAILVDLGRLPEAEVSYRQAIELTPDSAAVYNNLGVMLQALGRNQDAESIYTKAIALKPDYDEALYNLGLLLFETSQYEKAAVQFKLSNFEKSKYFLLRCLYIQDKKTLFYDQLDYFINQGKIHPMIGSLGCRSALKYGIDKPNLFCKDPLNYVLKTDLSDRYNFEKIFIKTANTILNEKRIPSKRQALLTNGYQTSGNLFNLERDLTKDIQKIIRLEIKKYLDKFNGSKEGFITNWPTNYGLKAWLVSMKTGGELRPHMHEKGWISGSVYINVPEKSKTKSGNLVVCIEEEQLKGKHKNQEKSIDVVTGSLCLFPASLLHYTIPFESEEERIVLAFDVVPGC